MAQHRREEGGQRGIRRKKVVDISSVVLPIRVRRTQPLNSLIYVLFSPSPVYPIPYPHSLATSPRSFACYPLAERGRATARNLRENL